MLSNVQTKASISDLQQVEGFSGLSYSNAVKSAQVKPFIMIMAAMGFAFANLVC